MKIAFIIPFHNEESNVVPMISQVVKYCKKKKWDFTIIPVDDQSTDNTTKYLKDLEKKYTYISPIYRKNNGRIQGNTMGLALIEGTKKAKTEFIIWTMGDLADQPDTYGEIVSKLAEGYDMVFGSRYMPGGSRGNLDPIKAFLSSWGTILSQFLFGVPVHDITNAFRGFRKKIFRNLKLESMGFNISPEFAIKAHLAGFNLTEVPTIYTNRVEGVSSFKLTQMTINYLKLYVDIFIKYILLRRTFDFLKNKSSRNE